jgi:cytohesin
LLRHGADREQLSKYGWTPVLLAAQNGRAETLEVLLDAGARVDRTGRAGRTALMLAAGGGSYRSVRVLLKHGANPRRTDDEGRSPMMYAAGLELPEWGADGLPAMTPRAHNVVRGLMRQVAVHDRMATIRELARAGADPNRHDRRGRTPLGMSIEREETGVAQTVYAIGGRCDPGERYPQLVIDAALGRLPAVERDVAAGSPVDVRDRDGITPLVRAVQADDPELVRWLLAHGASLDRVAGPGGTALHWAIGAGRLGLAEELLRAGANCNARDPEGWTPLAVAATRGDRRLVEVLLDHGASTSVRSNRGRTVLYPAAIGGPDMVQLLLERGPDLRPGGALGSELPAFLEWCRRSRILDGGVAEQIARVVESFSGVFTSP